MCQHFRVLGIVFALLLYSQIVFAQTEISRAGPNGNDNSGSSGVNDKANAYREVVSPQANAESKRLFKSGVKYARSGLFKQASELFQKAVQLNPNFADAHYSLGHVYLDLGRWDDAIRSLEHALRLNPKDKEAREMLEDARALAKGNGKPDQQPSEELNQSSSAIAGSSSPPQNHTAGGTTVSLTARTDPGLTATSASETDLTRVYHIGVGDVLDVRLGNDPAAQSTLFTVTPSGLLEHPLLAEPMPVAGLTVDEAKSRLEADLKRRAVSENPKVLVGVSEYLSHAIIVSGLVKEPGTKLLRREAIPLFVVLADAQPAPEAGRATVLRHETGEALVVDLTKPTEMSLLVRTGDVITVQANPKQFFYVGGEVKTPGEKPFRPGITLTQAILAAGGLSRDSKAAHVARESDKGFLSSTSYKLKDINAGKLADPVIQPGDRITVEH